MLFEIIELVVRLHPFRHAAKAEALGQAEDALHHGGGIGLGGDLAHETAVDLDPVQREAAQIGQR
jgi:hypothetical protein